MLSRPSKQINWQASLTLVLLGAVVGYSCFEKTNFWGGTESRYQILFITGFFVGSALFIAGFLNFLALAIRSLGIGQTPIPNGPARPNQSAASNLSDRQPIGLARSESGDARTRLMNNGMRTALIAVLVLDSLDIWYWGGPPLDSSYAYWYWLRIALTFFLSQLPYAVALIRIWPKPDRPGLALAMSASAMQVLATSFAGLRYPATARDPWPWLSVPLGAIVIACSFRLWPSTPKLKNDVGLLVSVFFGFLAYTALAQIAVGILHARTHA